jgi:glycosyltransferase involved in cell wall biosynthesis
MPKVSILIPTTGRPTLARTVQSLLSQSYKDWEAIIVANNLDDRELPRLPADPRLRLIDAGELTNDTGASARNLAFECARGEYIATLDDDDWLERSFLWVMLREIKKQGVDLLYCRTNLWSRDGRTRYGTWLRPFDADLLPRAGYILSPSVLFRREMLEGYTLHADKRGRNSDWRFYVERCKAGFKFGYIDRLLANLTVDENIWRYWAPGGFAAEKGAA